MSRVITTPELAAYQDFSTAIDRFGATLGVAELIHTATWYVTQASVELGGVTDRNVVRGYVARHAGEAFAGHTVVAASVEDLDAGVYGTVVDDSTYAGLQSVLASIRGGQTVTPGLLQQRVDAQPAPAVPVSEAGTPLSIIEPLPANYRELPVSPVI